MGNVHVREGRGYAEPNVSALVTVHLSLPCWTLAFTPSRVQRSNFERQSKIDVSQQVWRYGVTPLKVGEVEA